MALLVPLITSYIAFFSHNKIASSSVTIRRIDENLTFVPQDITTDVSVLKLDKNLIQVLYNTSFSMYRRLQMLTLSDNPLWKIHNGTFDNNLSLGHFFCENCNIKILPSSFGPSSSRISSLRLGSGISKDAMVSPYFDSFVSLTTLRLNSNGLSNIDVINMPPSIKILSLYLNRIAEFPNVSFARFPILSSLNIEVNYLKHVSNSTLAGISNTLTLLSLYRNRLLDIGNLTVLTNLRIVGLERNQLETIPDMLGLSQLRSLYIDGNTRMTCDHRMCWRRLWDRVRAPLFSSDDATCKAPLAARGHSLSRINPGFMQCDQDKRFEEFFVGSSFTISAITGTMNDIPSITFHKKLVYDLVFEWAVREMPRVRTRSIVECFILCTPKAGCHGIRFNATALPHEDNCKFMKNTNCVLMTCH